MKPILALCVVLCALFATSVRAGEIAYTVRATELKAKPFADAVTVLTLAAHGKVEIVARHASWTQVKADGATGWVKMLSLRMSNSGAAKGGDNGLGALFNVAATGGSGSTVTTGVRGLSEENLKNAHPDPEALQALQGFAASKNEAVNFARTGKLTKQQMDYLAAPGKGEN